MGKRVKSVREVQIHSKQARRNQSHTQMDNSRAPEKKESPTEVAAPNKHKWNQLGQKGERVPGGRSLSRPQSPDRQKRKAPTLKTAFKVLQRHFAKVKDGLIAAFKEDLAGNFSGSSAKARTSQIKVQLGSKRTMRIVLKFGGPGEVGKIEPFVGTKANEEGMKTEQVWTSRSGRAVKNRHLLRGIEHQSKMEKLELSFLKELEKLNERIGKPVELGYFVYFRDYLIMLRKRLDKMLSKFPFMHRKKVVRLLASDILAVRDDFIRETQLEHSKLASHMNKFKISSNFHPRTYLQSRIFNELTDYKTPESLEMHLVESSASGAVREKYSVESLLRSDKVPQCESECACCVQTIEAFCDFKATQCGWESACADKQAKIECDSRCACDENCQNSFIRKKRFIKSDKDVSIRQTWGIDFYSRKNLFHLLPTGLNVDQKALIIDSIVRQLNFLGHEGWNVLLAAQIVLKKVKALAGDIKDAEKLSNNHVQMKKWATYFGNSGMDGPAKLKELMRGLNVAIKQLKIKQLRDLVRAFSKGLGVVCTNPAGISSNSLVVQYFGEVFPPWLWYLKQDAIKQFLGQLRRGKHKELSHYKNNYSMEFYNIFLEKHRDEPNGTQLVIIDPIFKGNYASRLSHSCSPNCVTLPVVSQGKYSIGNCRRGI